MPGPDDKAAGRGMTWAFALLVSGHYEGTFEPCGCTAGQLGGQQWEVPLHNEIRAEWQHPVVSVCAGGNILVGTNPRGPLHAAIARVHGTYMREFLELAKFDYLCADARDVGVLSLETGASTVSVRPGEIRVPSASVQNLEADRCHRHCAARIRDA